MGLDTRDEYVFGLEPFDAEIHPQPLVILTKRSGNVEGCYDPGAFTRALRRLTFAGARACARAAIQPEWKKVVLGCLTAFGSSLPANSTFGEIVAKLCQTANQKLEGRFQCSTRHFDSLED